MRKFKYIFILTSIFIGISSVNAFDNTIKIYDYGQVLTEKEEVKLKKQMDEYINTYNIDMAIVTVKYYNQSTLSEYSNLFYTKNNFGIGDTKDGIIAVLDLKNNKIVGIQVFGKAKEYYSKQELNIINEKIKKENNSYDKFDLFIEEAFDYVDKYDTNSVSYKGFNNFSLVNWFNAIIVSFIFSTAFILLGILKNKYVKKEENNKCCVTDKIVDITKKEDKFITTKTKKERIGK